MKNWTRICARRFWRWTAGGIAAFLAMALTAGAVADEGTSLTAGCVLLALLLAVMIFCADRADLYRPYIKWEDYI